MLGLPDVWISLVYFLCILSAVACVAYGFTNWNKGGDNEILEIEEEANWEKTENN